MLLIRTPTDSPRPVLPFLHFSLSFSPTVSFLPPGSRPIQFSRVAVNSAHCFRAPPPRSQYADTRLRGATRVSHRHQRCRRRLPHSRTAQCRLVACLASSTYPTKLPSCAVVSGVLSIRKPRRQRPRSERTFQLIAAVARPYRGAMHDAEVSG